MAEIVAMPKLGFDMAEGTLVRWVIAEGQPVQKGAVLAEIETDKATVEVESSFGGMVFKHLVEQGAIVPVGKPIAVIAAEGEKVDPTFWQSKGPTAPMTAEKTSTPVSQEKTEPEPVLLKVDADQQSTQFKPSAIKASPLAKKIAREQKVDLGQVTGSGPEGRIVRRDVETALKTLQLAPALAPGKPAQAQKPAAASPILDFRAAPIPPDEKIQLNRLRAAIGRRMGESKQQVPHFYITRDYRIDDLLDLREQWNEIAGEENRLSINDFIVKAAALSLRKFPNLNASLVGDSILRHGHANIGVAVAVPGGLLTVVCKDADQKSLPAIGREIREMAVRAREGKVRPEDIEGSTFSISNLGMYDVENFAAIINPPEAAILAVGAAREVAAIQDGEIIGCRMMKITISADHRVTDGAEAAQFMQLLGEFLSAPLGILTIV
jgi:pyruvate dehydrogenase E2 component (dihydrolipoamide acetyltransferase)